MSTNAYTYIRVCLYVYDYFYKHVVGIPRVVLFRDIYTALRSYIVAHANGLD